MRLHLGAMALVLAMAVPRAAGADPRLDEVVYDPFVEAHVAEFEARSGWGLGQGSLGGETTTVVEGEYGLNDRLSLAVVGVIARPKDAPTHLASYGLEAVGSVGQIPIVKIDTALYLELKHGQGGDSDGVEGKLLLAKTAGRFQGLVNLIVERPLGAPAAEGFATYGYAASATWRTLGELRLGAEAFGDLGSDHGGFGRQGAYVGPQVKWEVHPRRSPVEIGLDAGWLVPVGTDRGEARSQARVAIDVERHL